MADEDDPRDKAIASLKAKGKSTSTDAVEAYLLGRKDLNEEVIARLKGHRR